MFSFLSRWRPVHLAAGWIAYWVGLAVVKLGPAAMTIWRLTRDDPTGQNTVSLGLENTTLQLSMTELGTPVYAGSATLTEIALWIAIPPLLLLFAWLQRPTLNEGAVSSPTVRAELEAGQAEPLGKDAGAQRVRERSKPHH